MDGNIGLIEQEKKSDEDVTDCHHHEHREEKNQRGERCFELFWVAFHLAYETADKQKSWGN